MVYEDFYTYTELDPGDAFITINNANKVTYNCCRNVDARLFKDYGVGHFADNYEHLITTEVQVMESSRYFFVWFLGNVIDDQQDYVNNNWPMYAVYFYAPNIGEENLRLFERTSGGVFQSDTYLGAANTTYYLTIKKSGTALSCKVYSAEARTPGDLLDTLTLTLNEDNAFRYLYVAQTRNSGHIYCVTGYNEKLDLQEVVAVNPMGLNLKPAPKGGTGRPAMLTGGASFGG